MNSPPLQYIGLFIYGSAWHRLRCVVSVIFAAMFSLLTTSQIFTSASEKFDYDSNTHTHSLSLAVRGSTSSPLASYLSWPATFLTHSNRDFFFFIYTNDLLTGYSWTRSDDIDQHPELPDFRPSRTKVFIYFIWFRFHYLWTSGGCFEVLKFRFYGWSSNTRLFRPR